MRADDLLSSALLRFYIHHEILADPIGKRHLARDRFHRNTGNQFTQIWHPSNCIETHLAHAGNGRLYNGMDRECCYLVEIDPVKEGKTDVLKLADRVYIFRHQLLGLLRKNHSIPLVERPVVKYPTDVQMISPTQPTRVKRFWTIFIEV